MSEPIYCDDDQRCPRCGGRVMVEADCPGYGTPRDQGGKGVLVCWPACGNAMRYDCDDCEWWYREPSSPHRFDRATMGERPAWLTDDSCQEGRGNG